MPSSFLRADATAPEAAQWLMTCRFEKYVTTFAHFSGSDILRLTRSDLIQICDLTDGIRLYNSLHCQSLRPRSTIYVSTSPNEDFSAIYLESLTAQELRSKLCNLLSTSMSNGCNGKTANGTASHHQAISISRMRMAGPAGIFIAVTDDVVRNIPHEAMFMLDFERGSFSPFVTQVSTTLCFFSPLSSRWIRFQSVVTKLQITFFASDAIASHS